MTRALADIPIVFTPATLAERWACSERHVRNMIETGELPAFKLGGKLLRIRAVDVEMLECPSGQSPASEASSAFHGPIQPSQAEGDVIDLERQIEKRRNAVPRLDTRNSPVR